MNTKYYSKFSSFIHKNNNDPSHRYNANKKDSQILKTRNYFKMSTSIIVFLLILLVVLKL